MIDNDKLKNFFNLLVVENRKIILPYFRKKIEVETKTDLSPVTIADKLSEKKIRALILENFPEHGIQGEEFPNENLDSEYQWIIDPIDGTRSFIVGRPTFGTLVGLYKQKEPLAGLIDMPVLEETWIGIKNNGSYFNGSKIKTKNTKQLSLSTIACTSPNMFNKSEFGLYTKVEKKCKNSVWGGDCHNFALLAGGYLEIVIENNLSWHDIAALVPVIEEAGGCVCDWKGNKVHEKGKGDIIACNNEFTQKEVLKLMMRNK